MEVIAPLMLVSSNGPLTSSNEAQYYFLPITKREKGFYQYLESERWIIFVAENEKQAKLMNVIVEAILDQSYLGFLDFYHPNITIRNYIKVIENSSLTYEKSGDFMHHDLTNINDITLGDTLIFDIQGLKEMLKYYRRPTGQLFEILQRIFVAKIELDFILLRTDNPIYWFYHVYPTFLDSIRTLPAVRYYRRFTQPPKPQTLYTSLMDEGAIVIRASRYSEAMLLNRILRTLFSGDFTVVSSPFKREVDVKEMIEIIGRSNELINSESNTPGIKYDIEGFRQTLVFDKFNVSKLLQIDKLLDVYGTHSFITLLTKNQEMFR
jgi:hypothetical protein